MKLNKKIGLCLCMLVLTSSFVGCSSKSSKVSSVGKNVAVTKTKLVAPVAKEQTQEELNQKIKSKATKADFVAINGHEAEYKGKARYVEGKVTNVDNTNTVLPVFTVTTKEGSGYGMYDILNFETVKVAKGDKVKVYGGVDGVKNDKGMIQISGNVIEKQK